MNRQIVWHSFTVSRRKKHRWSSLVRILQLTAQSLMQEFLLFLLPLINARSVKRRLSRTLSKTASLASTAVPPSIKPYLGMSSSSPQGDESSLAESEASRERKGKYWALSEDQCAICAEDAAFDISNLSQSLAAAASTPSVSSTRTYGPARPRSRPSTTMAQEEASTSSNDQKQGDQGGEEEEREDSALPPRFHITTAYETSCGHVYCYFCLAGRMIGVEVDDDNQDDAKGEGGRGWECLRCTSTVKGCRRVEEKLFAEEMGSQDGLSDDGLDTSLVSLDSEGRIIH